MVSRTDISSRKEGSKTQGIVVATMSFLLTALAVEGLCGLILYLKEAGLFSLATGAASLPVRASVRHTNFRLIRHDKLGMSRPAPGQYETVYATTEKQVTCPGKS